ncbi:MAG: VIT1/CCC1 transporter family protein [Atribacterota bacterium]|nr:VIT1/CCC1 transporter family protein [Atribacterota bacterium]MDD4896734.1 VIT1/CCC1 transporter family protein [Atribacterota bacterium]MDD5637722.1 VIT1/CCC1 transporter family protein [Atribacterota bacterium]
MNYKLSEKEINELKKAQQDELVGEQVYGRLAKLVKDPRNSKILAKISNDEKEHAQIFKKYTKVDLKVDKLRVFFYVFISRVFGLTFGVKLQEKGEEQAQKNYKQMLKAIPEMKEIIEAEEKHEVELINMINEEKLTYMSSVVLGLNDALVELTGALAGFTLSIQNSRIIALLGLITGISASLSMAASEYLSTKAEPDPKEQERAGKSAFYTGIAYILTVIALITPYFLISNYFYSLAMTIIIALVIIFVFNYYISVANDYNFKKRFMEMAFISIGVAALSFIIGYLVKTFLGFEL